MDIQTIKTRYPLLLEYLKKQEFSLSTLYNYNREFKLMLESENEISELEGYCKHVEKTCSKKRRDFYKRFPYIKRIWHFLITGEFPAFNEKKTQTLPDAFENLLDVCAQESKNCGHKNKTTSDYIDVGRCFLRYLVSKDILDLDKVTEFIVQDFFANENGKKRGRTISGRLRRFFLLCQDTIGIREANVLASFVPSIPQKTKVYPNLEGGEANAIEAVLLNEKSVLTDLERAVGCLAFYMGLRCSEIINLSKSNLDFKNRSIHIIQQKTNVPLKIPMPTVCSNAIVKYVRDSRPKSTVSNIFIRPRTLLQIKKCDLYDISNHILVLAGIPIFDRKMRGLHLFRHYFASSLIRNNADISIASALLGHSSPDSTFVYLGTDINKLRACALPLL